MKKKGSKGRSHGRHSKKVSEGLSKGKKAVIAAGAGLLAAGSIVAAKRHRASKESAE